MKKRITVNPPQGDFAPSRRSTLTRLARIAKACGAITLFGVSAEKSFASGNLGTYQGNIENVNFDGSR